REDLANQLELGSLELEPTLDRNALLERMMRVVLQSALDPTQKGIEVQNRINQIGSMIRRYSSQSLKQILQEAVSAHKRNHPRLKEWAEELSYQILEKDLNHTYQEVHQMALTVRSYVKLLDRGGKIRVPRELISTLDTLLRKMEK